ncbi:MAG: hypothetical protein H7A23_09015 [Leptospiraceae bacterium]|nr:hypothetical protein [Leptospiraceae bacterium]MCP5494683.1 hypothetical protein [Leptospiraceae bacterium]
MNFKFLSEIKYIQNIAIGNAIREVRRLNIKYGEGDWKKRKGVAKKVFVTI